MSTTSCLVPGCVSVVLFALAAGAALAAPAATPAPPAPAKPLVLTPDTFAPLIDQFNRDDRELFPQAIPNAAAWAFLRDNIPLLDCPDPEIQQTYYFRWWTYRKHLKATPDGFVVTEFLPAVPWAGKHNTISCAAGHHLHEGRWLRDPRYLDDYATFWFRRGGAPRAYSFWAAEAIWARTLVTGDDRLPRELLPDLVRNYEAWEQDHRDPSGLYWQVDDRDGMEVSLSGKLHPQAQGYRATLNSYQYGDALAIAAIAERAGNADLAAQYRAKAATLKQLVEAKLWDEQARFFKVLPRGENTKLSDARELHGYTPWYVNLPGAGAGAGADKADAWKQLLDPQGFAAPFGPTTAEQRHPGFAVAYQGHECQWNGPSWPYATAITLTALANLLNNYQQGAISRRDYFELLKVYTRSHHLRREDGKVVPWIDENLNPQTGDWLSRTRLKTWKNGSWDPGKGGEERGKDYNHSTYCDLVISGLIGLRPRIDDTIEVNPLVPEGTWDWFCLDQIWYHGQWVTIQYDKTGERYHRGKGLRVFADGKEVAVSENLARVTGQLPARSAEAAAGTAAATSAPAALPGADTAGGWVKYAGNPVLGGKLGTCFDIAVLRDKPTGAAGNDANQAPVYRMWFSWRPRKSVALTESADGLHWSEPVIVLGPEKSTGWEDDINRPAVVKRGDTYHLWYTGQAKGRSALGYATSPDGKTWTRQSAKPVLAAAQPWEKVAVMCPHVLWDEDAKLYRMWYSGGAQYEPDAIGYATSPDGLTWTKPPAPRNPVFQSDPAIAWERHKVTACQVERVGDWFVMFYIGFRDVDHAQIGLARSRDGLTNWQRHPANPIIRPTPGGWDHDACYKPYAIFDGQRWLLWYNGRHGGVEQIGVAMHEGEELRFPK